MGNSSELVLVKWPEHHEELIARLWDFVNTNYRVDWEVQLLNGKWIRAHQLIMDVFIPPENLSRKQFSSHSCSTLPPEEHQAATCLTEFMYKGQVAVSRNELDNLHRVAKKLNFKMLADAVEAVGGFYPETSSERRRRKKRSKKKSNVHHPLAPPAAELSSEATTPVEPSFCQLSVLSEWQGIIDALQSNVERLTPEQTRDDQRQAEAVEMTKLPPPLHLPRINPDGSRRPTVTRSESSKLYRQRLPLVKCGRCSYQTRDRGCYGQHCRRYHPTVKVPTCAVCKGTYFTKHSLARHLSRKHGISTSADKVDQLNGSASAAEHRRMYLEGKDPPPAQRNIKRLRVPPPLPVYKCGHCNYSVVNKGCYTTHLANYHADSVEFKCPSCQRAFLSAQSLANHRTKYSGGCSAINTCPHCDYRTKAKQSWYNHLYTQHGITAKGKPVARKLQCAECDYSAFVSSQMKQHVLIKHSGLKPFQCQRCSFSTNHRSGLKTHVDRVHIRSKPFICEICGHRSSCKQDSNRHSMTHTGQKPYPCSSCGLCFADRYTLKAHIRARHTHEKPYICHVCSHAFCNLSNLKKHLKKVHDTL